MNKIPTILILILIAATFVFFFLWQSARKDNVKAAEESQKIADQYSENLEKIVFEYEIKIENINEKTAKSLKSKLNEFEKKSEIKKSEMMVELDRLKKSTLAPDLKFAKLEKKYRTLFFDHEDLKAENIRIISERDSFKLKWDTAEATLLEKSNELKDIVQDLKDEIKIRIGLERKLERNKILVYGSGVAIAGLIAANLLGD